MNSSSDLGYAAPLAPDGQSWPTHFDDEAQLDAFLATPTRALLADMKKVDGDLLILGVSGKMGPTLARLARNALPGRRIIGVARFADPASRAELERHGIETIACDMLSRDALAQLPLCPNVIFMAGRKFGADGDHAMTWAVNTYVPALVAERFKGSRIVAFSTACVYAFVPTDSRGASEDALLDPPGEYANSCIGRERLFEHFSRLHDTPGRLFRLSYAIDLRYGVLSDVARKVFDGESIDVTMGHVNVIWQGDANAQALRCLAAATVPTTAINVSGPETVSIRWLAHEFAKRFERPAVLTGIEAPTAWLVNTAQAERLFGYPCVPLLRQVDWVAEWTRRGGRLFGKPTHFEARDGRY